MATLEDVAGLVRELPGVREGERHGMRTWFVGDRAFCWERPFSKADLRRFGDVAPPKEPIVALCVEDLGDKEAVLAAGHRGVFTIPHFDGYAAVLVELGAVRRPTLRAAVVDAWLARAPADLASAYLAARRGKRRSTRAPAGTSPR